MTEGRIKPLKMSKYLSIHLHSDQHIYIDEYVCACVYTYTYTYHVAVHNLLSSPADSPFSKNGSRQMHHCLTVIRLPTIHKSGVRGISDILCFGHCKKPPPESIKVPFLTL